MSQLPGKRKERKNQGCLSRTFKDPPISGDLLPAARPYLLKVLQPLKIALSTGSQISKGGGSGGPSGFKS